MFKQLKLMAGLAITATLVACGGGGESDSSSVSVNNPLKKYEGTWYFCDGTEKTIYSISTTGTDGLHLNYSQEFYEKPNCSGQLFATYKWDTPQLITYKDATSATLPPATIFPFSATVDSVTLLTSPSRATLTGPRVYGKEKECVRFDEIIVEFMPTIRTKCFDLVLQQRTSSGALYLTADNQYLLQLRLSNGVLVSDQILSRDSRFNLASLVKR
jgi:hypothetical protein